MTIKQTPTQEPASEDTVTEAMIMEETVSGQMHPYGAMAMAHMQTYLPIRYSQIDNPDSYFRSLGEQIAEEVLAVFDHLRETTRLPTDDYPARAATLNSLKMRAEEVVLAELVYPAPEQPNPDPGGDGEADEDGDDLEGWDPETLAANRALNLTDPGWLAHCQDYDLDPQTGMARWAQAEPENWTRYCARFGVNPETGEPSGTAPRLLSTSTPATRTDQNGRGEPSEQIRGARREPMV
jgi:hypothetical protein